MRLKSKIIIGITLVLILIGVFNIFINTTINYMKLGYVNDSSQLIETSQYNNQAKVLNISNLY